jgi:hypothetical protein
MLIILGHDEAIMKQYLLTNKHRTGSNGEKAISPKDEGQGIMISVFQCHEFGFGMKNTDEELATFNRYCEIKYLDKDAAKAKQGTRKEAPLTSSPFVLEYEYGANAEGYWVYEHMVLQL